MNATVSTIGWWLVVIAAVNLGLYYAFGFDVVSMVLGSYAILERVFYILVGLSGLWMLYERFGRR